MLLNSNVELGAQVVLELDDHSREQFFRQRTLRDVKVIVFKELVYKFNQFCDVITFSFKYDMRVVFGSYSRLISDLIFQIVYILLFIALLWNIFLLGFGSFLVSKDEKNYE